MMERVGCSFFGDEGQGLKSNKFSLISITKGNSVECSGLLRQKRSLKNRINKPRTLNVALKTKLRTKNERMALCALKKGHNL